jgi:hypothetical protein
MVGFQLDELYNILQNINHQSEDEHIFFESLDEHEFKFKYLGVSFVVRYNTDERPEIVIKMPFNCNGSLIAFSNTCDEFEELIKETFDCIAWDDYLPSVFKPDHQH